MKPVIKKQIYYSMLLMRDDTSVRTLRVRGSSITSFFIFLLLLLLSAVGGVWGGVHYWKKYTTLSERHKLQDKELSEARLQLERFNNYETVLMASNGGTPLAKNEEIGASAPPPPSQNGTQANPSVAANSPGAALSQHNASLAAQSAEISPQGTQTTETPLISSDASPLRINNFTGRLISSQRLRIRYELSTIPSDDQKVISGTAKYRASTNGTQIELPVQDTADSRFAISRMKVMDANIRLPATLNARDLSQVDVVIELDDGKVFNDTFSLTR